MGADIEQKDPYCRTNLHRALNAKDFQLAKQLVEQGADVRACNWLGLRPLHLLAQLSTDYLDILSPSPFAEMIQVLSSARADINARNSYNGSPLSYAYSEESSLIFRLLVDAGADLSLLDRKVGTDMRHFLARVLQYSDDTADGDYLPASVDVNATYSRGDTYLDRAVWLGSPSAVKALLLRGADPKGRGHWGRTPLHYTFNLMRHPNGAGAIRALIDAGANVDDTLPRRTPLDVAISRTCPPAFRIILAGGGWTSEKNIVFSDRFLHAPEGTDAVIDVIEAKKLFGFMPGQDSDRVLCRAAQRGSPNAIRWLLGRGANPNIRDDQGRTPLHYSVDLITRPEGEETLSALIEKGAHIDATDSDEKTPLQLAVAKSSCRAVQSFLRRGADPHAGGPFGAASPGLVVSMLEDPDGISMVLALIGAEMTIDKRPRYYLNAHSRSRCLELVREVRKILVEAPTRNACVAFLSTFYPLVGTYPGSDIPLYECEIKLTKTEKSGEGGFSDCFEGVFLGHHKVAMKALRAHLEEEVMERRMKREMGVWSRLDHPNVLPFIGWHTFGPTSYMVSPWMENGDALAYVERRPQANRLQLVRPAVIAADGYTVYALTYGPHSSGLPGSTSG
ncbi:hypothetical protein BOTBODRAFT_491533 [Botryobasidium botryosum FD-172 SS1]|uniref:Protein kinase domain-containing protein n=1 Tax=Botryobasidium botryosum (strain FD-172 SS1) TaxID=930990 RepID=A0A067MFV6_BOTB1|nr:hypothetical protein BOTBODRAFT_491533 [Botryobasidium botryosum FD-172 SS1]